MKKTSAIRQEEDVKDRDVNLKAFNYFINTQDLSFEQLNHIEEQFFDKRNYIPIGEPYKKTSKKTINESILHSLREAHRKGQDFVILCKHCHDFRPSYSDDFLKSCIIEADKLEANILLGGATGLVDAVKIEKHLFWIDFFTSSTFIIVYKRFYEALIQSLRELHQYSLESIISLTEKNIILIYPFISFPREFRISKPPDTYAQYYQTERALTFLHIANKKFRKQQSES